MTFSQNVKNEISRNVRNKKGCCAKTYLKAALKAIGSLSLSHKGFSFTMESDNYEFLTLCHNIAKNELNVESSISSYNVNAKGVAVYSCEFLDNIGEKLGLTKRDSEGIMDLVTSVPVPEKECCKRSFMQGLFMSCGSVVIPSVGAVDDTEQKSAQQYHLELRFTDLDFAKSVMEAYSAIEFRMSQRKNYYILYLKDSEKIADFLVYVDAMANRLQLEKIIIERSVRNDANRQSNCIAANIDKAVDASAWQLKAISVLKQNGKFDMLPDKLKEIAAVREEFPEASLDEIAKRLKISKSGANHRFAKLKELSQD